MQPFLNGQKQMLKYERMTDMIPAESLGAKLRRLRKARKLTQCQLADMIGITTGQISKYENGEIKPCITTLEWLCEFFGVTASDLLGF